MQTDWPNQPASIRAFVLVCAALELAALAGTVLGLGGAVRNLLLTFGAFWPDLLAGAPPIYPGQSIAMFATSAFLHGGLLHLFMNMVAMLWLGPMVTSRVGERAFWPLAGLCALGAGAVYGLLSTTSVPMVGAFGRLSSRRMVASSTTTR